MTGVNEGKRQVSGEEAQTNLSKTPGTDSSAQPNPIKPSKITLKYPKKRMLKALPASGTTRNGEVTKYKRRRVKPSRESGEKVTEGRSATVDDFKEVKERARLAVLQGGEDTSKMVAHLVKGIWLGIEDEKSDLKKANVKLEKELARSRTDALKLGRHLMLKGYYEEEEDAIKADTYVEEEYEEEAEAVGIVDDLHGVSRQTVLNNKGITSSSQKAVRKMSLRINDLESGLARERETSKALLSAQRELQGHVKKGNTNLRECQHKLDVVLIREKVLEGEIKAKELLVKRKEELLEDMPAREELNAEIRRLRSQVVDLEAMNLTELTKLESCLKRMGARFVTMVIPDASRSDLLKAIVAYFIKEVKKLESERDTLFKTLSDKGCICGAKIDRGNCLGIMETQLGSQTAKLIDLGRAVVTRELKVGPLDIGGSTADSPLAEKKPL
ncbi:hypothetical protein GIB67_028667 [Kingdonia uniflora]|uniref:Uncharacterized protein n=1 Tax=Kingdonia uniflora TaxID=39325 RepID=A0A7J7MTP7_9MAGN|nr:hypothetical protein GIB67_028667 [Kingdonia uniflora]